MRPKQEDEIPMLLACAPFRAVLTYWGKNGSILYVCIQEAHNPTADSITAGSGIYTGFLLLWR
jgi:hypothetical protein